MSLQIVEIFSYQQPPWIHQYSMSSAEREIVRKTTHRVPIDPIKLILIVNALVWFWARVWLPNQIAKETYKSWDDKHGATPNQMITNQLKIEEGSRQSSKKGRWKSVSGKRKILKFLRLNLINRPLTDDLRILCCASKRSSTRGLTVNFMTRSLNAIEFGRSWSLSFTRTFMRFWSNAAQGPALRSQWIDEKCVKIKIASY